MEVLVENRGGAGDRLGRLRKGTARVENKECQEQTRFVDKAEPKSRTLRHVSPPAHPLLERGSRRKGGERLWNLVLGFAW